MHASRLQITIKIQPKNTPNYSVEACFDLFHRFLISISNLTSNSEAVSYLKSNFKSGRHSAALSAAPTLGGY